MTSVVFVTLIPIPRVYCHNPQRFILPTGQPPSKIETGRGQQIAAYCQLLGAYVCGVRTTLPRSGLEQLPKGWLTAGQLCTINTGMYISVPSHKSSLNSVYYWEILLVLISTLLDAYRYGSWMAWGVLAQLNAPVVRSSPWPRLGCLGVKVLPVVRIMVTRELEINQSTMHLDR